MSTGERAATDERPPRLGRDGVRAITAATVGWAVDIFDLMIVLQIAAQVSATFFPSHNPLLGLTATYASFAISLLVRPIGSLVFGSMADRTGRRRAMLVAVLGAGTATTLIGALPGASAIGVAAPLALIALRIVQGVFVGGVAASTHTLATESVPERYRGLTAGTIKGGGAGLAVIVTNLLVIAVTSVAGPAGFNAWGWRLVFGSALLWSFANWLVLRRTPESPLWADQAPPRRSPWRALFTRQWRMRILVTSAIVFTSSTPYYLTTGILPTVYQSVFHVGRETTSVLLIVNVFGSALVAAVCGHISQRIGRKRAFLIFGLLCLVVIPTLYTVMWRSDAPGLGLLQLCGALMAMVSGAPTAPLMIFLNERFPTGIRSSGTAFTWNVGYGLSGMAPTFVVAVSSSIAGILPTLIVCALVVCAAFVLLTFTAPETRGALERDG